MLMLARKVGESIQIGRQIKVIIEMKRYLAALGLLTIWLVATASAGDGKTRPAQDDANYWMKKKIELSQDILVGLSLSDLESVGKNGQAMLTLSKIEGWARRKNTNEYRRQLRFFVEANSELVRQASSDNLDGATLAFTQMTISCVNCHKLLRDVE